MTWSKTTVNRSSRASPRSTSACAGTVTAGLQLYTKSPLTGGSRGSVSTRASRVMLTVRVFQRTPPSTASRFAVVAPPLLMVYPPPRTPNLPRRAGIARIAAIA